MSVYQRISAATAADLIRRARAGVKPLALFDSRDEASYLRSHVKGADRLTEQGFGDVVASLPKHVPVMIYCYHGNASQVYASMFADFHFTEVYSVDGGYEHLAPVIPDVPRVMRESSQTLRDFLREWHFDAENLDSPWDHGLTPLMRAALLGRDDMVEELLALGVNIHLRNSDGNNALWLACVSSNTKIVKRLIDEGIDLDNCNLTGATTLMYTASSGKPEMTELLLEAGADANIATLDGFRAVELAATEECLKLLRHTA